MTALLLTAILTALTCTIWTLFRSNRAYDEGYEEGYRQAMNELVVKAVKRYREEEEE